MRCECNGFGFSLAVHLLLPLLDAGFYIYGCGFWHYSNRFAFISIASAVVVVVVSCTRKQIESTEVRTKTKTRSDFRLQPCF